MVAKMRALNYGKDGHSGKTHLPAALTRMWILLQKTPGPGPVTMMALIPAIGTPEEVVNDCLAVLCPGLYGEIPIDWRAMSLIGCQPLPLRAVIPHFTLGAHDCRYFFLGPLKPKGRLFLTGKWRNCPKTCAATIPLRIQSLTLSRPFFRSRACPRLLSNRGQARCGQFSLDRLPTAWLASRTGAGLCFSKYSGTGLFQSGEG